MISTEFYKRRKSSKWKLRNNKKIIRTFNDNFVTDLKSTNPSKWYGMAKKIEAVKIARHFAAVSQEYLPLDKSALPSYLPAAQPPNISELQVYQKLRKVKKTKSTQPIDLPYKLRKEFSPELATPVTDNLQSFLDQHIYPCGNRNG